MQYLMLPNPAVNGECCPLTLRLGIPYSYYRKWKLEGVFEQINDYLVGLVRRMLSRNASPSLAIIDSRSVKASRQGGDEPGYDDGKKVKGRKHHIIVDSLGLLLAIAVHSATPHDNKVVFSVDKPPTQKEYVLNMKKN
jgi:transposase